MCCAIDFDTFLLQDLEYTFSGVSKILFQAMCTEGLKCHVYRCFISLPVYAQRLLPSTYTQNRKSLIPLDILNLNIRFVVQISGVLILDQYLSSFIPSIFQGGKCLLHFNNSQGSSKLHFRRLTFYIN